MALAAPVVNGTPLRRPSSYERTPLPVSQTATLASGRETVYTRGHRYQFELSWRNLPEVDALAIERVGRLRTPFSYVDPTGTGYVVRVPEGGFSGLEVVAGTSPERYGASLTLVEVTPR